MGIKEDNAGRLTILPEALVHQRIPVYSSDFKREKFFFFQSHCFLVCLFSGGGKRFLTMFPGTNKDGRATTGISIFLSTRRVD